MLAVVNPLHLGRFGHREGFDRHAVAHRQGDDIGQIVLALRVVIIQFGDPIFQPIGGNGQNSGIDLAQISLGGRRFLMFDDAQHPPALVADDAPVAGRVAQFDRQQRQPALSGVRDQRLQGLGLDQGHVAIQHLSLIHI